MAKGKKKTLEGKENGGKGRKKGRCIIILSDFHLSDPPIPVFDLPFRWEDSGGRGVEP